MKPAILIELLQRAAAEPFGLWVSTNNTRALVEQLIRLQRELQLSDLMVCTPSIENVIFVIHRSVELD